MILAITGPTSGIGAVTFSKLTPHFEKVLLLARNPEKAQEMISSLPMEQQAKAEFVHVDLASMDTIIQGVKTIQGKVNHIDVLINNAGGIFHEKSVTEDGFELTLSANHLGHFLLTNKLMPWLLKSSMPKVINVSSEAHKAARVNFDDLNYEKIHTVHSQLMPTSSSLMSFFQNHWLKNTETKDCRLFPYIPEWSRQILPVKPAASSNSYGYLQNHL